MTNKELLAWTMSSIGAGFAIVMGANAVFETKSEAKGRVDVLSHYLEQRLDSIEKKVDRIEDTLINPDSR